MQEEPTIDRLLALIRREARASEVSILPSQEAGAEVQGAVTLPLPHGRLLVVRFDEPVADPAAVSAQLAELVKGFETLFEPEETEARSARDPYEILDEVSSLLRELVSQCTARDAVVIDALSPIVWACASGAFDPAEEPEVPVAKVIPLRPNGAREEVAAPSTEDEQRSRAREALDEAIAKARAMPEMAHVRRGGHLHAVLRDDAQDVVVQSFASNYLVLVVCDPPVDEIGVQRTLHGLLPTVERLVVTMPPIEPDPAPMAGVIRLRRFRR